MVADTKNKRGRPAIFGPALYAIWFDKEKRTAQNLYYVGQAVAILGEDKPGSFFVTDKGNFRRQGIAEQIGRMYSQDGYTEEECKRIAEVAITLIEEGYKAKDVERWIRTGRKTGNW